MQTQPDQPGKPGGGRRRSPLHLRPQVPGPEPQTPEPAMASSPAAAADIPAPGRPGTRQLRARLEATRARAEGAASWLETSHHYERLINRDGVVPVTARFRVTDLEFLAGARAEALGLAELGLRLIELHQPLDADGITSDPASPVQRCRSCMWRWPCPTFRTLSEVMDSIAPARSAAHTAAHSAS
jgi:hypothetical protein